MNGYCAWSEMVPFIRAQLPGRNLRWTCTNPQSLSDWMPNPGKRGTSATTKPEDSDPSVTTWQMCSDRGTWQIENCGLETERILTDCSLAQAGFTFTGYPKWYGCTRCWRGQWSIAAYSYLRAKSTERPYVWQLYFIWIHTDDLTEMQRPCRKYIERTCLDRDLCSAH